MKEILDKLKILSGLLVVFILLISILFKVENDPNPIERGYSFNTAKKIAEKYIYTGDLRKDYYCGCEYVSIRNIKKCSYAVRTNADRGKRIEYEHVVPASWFGSKLACWKAGGRKACSSEDAEFIRFESDLHNLRPVIGEINGDRSNLPYGESPNKKKQYGNCNFYVDFQNNVADPPDEIKGDLARISLYMIDKYELKLPAETIDMFNRWNLSDPPDEKEREINRRIEKIQGAKNYYIERTNY